MEQSNKEVNWDDLLQVFSKLEITRTEAKNQGLNDFSLLSSVLNVNDEVRLHTRFLYALLNPNGSHYQGTQFLKLFLEVIGRGGWLDLDSPLLVVHKEFGPVGNEDKIDLYISDGSKVIVIENKLNAKDQPGQVKRYLRAIGADKGNLPENTLFIYLSKGRSAPSLNALRYPEDKKKGVPPDPYPLRLHVPKNGQLETYLYVCVDGSHKPWAIYQNVNYRSQFRGHKSLLLWLEKCQEAAEMLEKGDNITWAIRDYRNAVKRATKEYSSNVESLKEHFDQKNLAGGSLHELAMKLAKELPKANEQWLHEAMTQKIDDILEAYVEKEAIEKIDLNNLNKLKPFVSSRLGTSELKELLYNRKSNFFGSGATSRGTFFITKEEQQADQVLLMLFYGSVYLHVGVVTRDGSQNDFDSIVRVVPLGRPSKLRVKLFPNARTYQQPLDGEGIVSLANFGESPQAEALSQLANHFCTKPSNDGDLL